MKVYVAILKDRHDDYIEVFYTREAAKDQILGWQCEYSHVVDYDVDLIKEDIWQADEEQEEGLIMFIQEHEVREV